MSTTLERVEQYCGARDLTIVHRLGFGVHGSVFATQSHVNGKQSAIKSYERETHYLRERDVYLRLRSLGVTNIRGSSVPQLLEYDDNLWLIEMTIVARPFVLDFAGAYLDHPPDFSEDVLAEWETEKREQFGTQWQDAKRILNELELIGVYMADVNPGNIAFEE